MIALLEAMRPYQWVKNLLVFAPLVFAERMQESASAIAATLAFVSFCLVSSGIYLLNDLLDLEKDKLHPEKASRPLASGRLSPGLAWAGFLGLIGGGVGLAVVQGFWLAPALYLVINVAYSARLKHVVVLDAMCISIGFLLRVHAGGQAIDAPVSAWLTLCTFFVALFLAFCKRRHELALLGDASDEHRASLRDYSVEFLDQMIAPLGAMTVLAYASYTISAETVEKFGSTDLVYTVPFVVFGIFRYLFLVHRRSLGGNPTKLLMKDIPTLLNIISWFAVCVWIVYKR